jgi:hypothetical protein
MLLNRVNGKYELSFRDRFDMIFGKRPSPDASGLLSWDIQYCLGNPSFFKTFEE